MNCAHGSYEDGDCWYCGQEYFLAQRQAEIDANTCVCGGEFDGDDCENCERTRPVASEVEA